MAEEPKTQEKELRGACGGRAPLARSSLTLNGHCESRKVGSRVPPSAPFLRVLTRGCPAEGHVCAAALSPEAPPSFLLRRIAPRPPLSPLSFFGCAALPLGACLGGRDLSVGQILESVPAVLWVLSQPCALPALLPPGLSAHQTRLFIPFLFLAEL